MSAINQRQGFIPFRMGNRLIAALPADAKPVATRIAMERKARKLVEIPSLADMASNLAGAIAKFALSGFKTVSEEQYQERKKVCDTCPLWDAAARAGWGRCNHKKCGCTKFKLLLATEKCPLDKWPKI